MSDFSQPGLITTFQDLNGSAAGSGKIESALEQLSDVAGVTLVLPCHALDLGQPALAAIIREVARAPYIRQVIVSLNGVDRDGVETARHEFARLPQRTRILWNDGPEMAGLQSRFTGKNAAPASGKGFNVWSALGLLFGEKTAGVIATQDADVASFRPGALARLCYPVAAPELGYTFSKMYYSRVTDRIYGRVSRLFLAPFLQGLVRVLGHQPLLDFLLSFRYPLAGEQCFRAELAGVLSVRSDWALEISLLCAAFRQANPREICQVDGGSGYDHKHQALGVDGSGLVKMAADIADALLSELVEEGLPVCETFLGALLSSYRRESREALRRYGNLAIMNDLPFDRVDEERTVEAFAKSLESAGRSFLIGNARMELPKWSSVEPEETKSLELAAFPSGNGSRTNS